MEIKENEYTTNVLMRVFGGEDGNFCDLAYVTFKKEELLKFLELKEVLKKLEKKYGVSYLPVSDYISWIEGIPNELEELNEQLQDEEHILVDEIPQNFLDANACRVEYGESQVSEYGVTYKTTIKHTSVEVSVPSISWDTIKQLLKNCDPKSVQFIKED